MALSNFAQHRNDTKSKSKSRPLAAPGRNPSASLRRDAKKDLATSYERFRRSLPPSAFTLNYTEHITETHNRDIIEMVLHNPMSQVELIRDINVKASSSSSSSSSSCVAIAIAFSCRLKRLQDVDRSVCQKLQGLYLFSVIELKQDALVTFLKRCPHLKSLTLACMEEEVDAEFLYSIFTRELLPELEYIEIGRASDAVVEAMASSPFLRKIVFRYPEQTITNDGFQKLVEAGGGLQLEAVKASIDRTNPSKTLTKCALMKTLPKFISKEANVCDLEAMELGRQRSTRSKPVDKPLDDKPRAGVERSGKLHRRDVRVALGNLTLN